MTERERTDYEWDWLGNQVGWDDDASSFYERSLGTITNGRTEEGEARPSALYLATNIDSSPGIEGGWDGAGWVEVDYGDSGNVESFTVHGECTDTGTDTCTDSPSDSVEERADNFRDGCTCGVEQHYSYRWDELNRLVDARRYDRVAGDWVYQTRLRYRYDAANQRTVEESFAHDGQNTSHRVALTVYPGHFERRGLERGSGTYDAQGTTTDTDATETQYMIAGARIVWDPEPDTMGGEFDRNRRATVRVSDLLGTSSAVLDIESRELLEMATYYPSGARENLWTDDAAAPLEPIGFTGKEADEEIGAVYFGERWLIPRLGRWATPDPLHVHASGGGEALNAYRYVGGNMLQATDPLGLTALEVVTQFRATIQKTWGEQDLVAASAFLVRNFVGELVATDARHRDLMGARPGALWQPGANCWEPLTNEDGSLTDAGRREVPQFESAMRRAWRSGSGRSVYERARLLARQYDRYIGDLAIPDGTEGPMLGAAGLSSGLPMIASQVGSRRRVEIASGRFDGRHTSVYAAMGEVYGRLAVAQGQAERAAVFRSLREQLRTIQRGWQANEYVTAAGDVIFIGEAGPILVIRPNGAVLRGDRTALSEPRVVGPTVLHVEYESVDYSELSERVPASPPAATNPDPTAAPPGTVASSEEER